MCLLEYCPMCLEVYNMGLFPFRKKKQTPEERAEMLYTEGMTLITNGYWDSAFNSISEATQLGHRGAMGQLAMMYIFGQGCEPDCGKGPFAKISGVRQFVFLLCVFCAVGP